ncbi:hypothetical protein ABI_44530 [Asticcacaulis biprosthecium C19]|uniref:Phasin family protein n=1 Tax=Asticcacaulis biprosthecium C19 TaxID=715226 RepID=F4QTF6_9CAUL|nr:hypothetical protein ABI_44530 [Asticcacaulis biprosthecium C19]
MNAIALPAADEINETIGRASDSLNQMSGECLALYADGLAATMAASDETSRRIDDIRKSSTEACLASVGRFTALSRDTLMCRTLADALTLQQRSLENLTDSVADASRIYCGLFEAWSHAVDPIVARAALGPQRLFRAFAD